MSTSAIVVRELHRTYGTGNAAVHALRGVSLSIDDGEVVALVGPSGSGKTTLLNCIAGLDRPDRGTVEVLATDVASLDYEAAVAWRRASVAIVFQATGLLPHLSARENVDIMLRLRGVERRERGERVDAALDALGLTAHADHRPAELSGGQQQRAALARALASRPELLIADEPTGQLDSETSEMVLAALRTHASTHGTTMLLATHDRQVVSTVDRSVELSDGATVTSAAAEAVGSTGVSR